jgi:hypothetical protein
MAIGPVTRACKCDLNPCLHMHTMQVRHLASMSPDRAAAALMSLQDDEEAAAKLVVGGASGMVGMPSLASCTAGPG